MDTLLGEIDRLRRLHEREQARRRGLHEAVLSLTHSVVPGEPAHADGPGHRPASARPASARPDGNGPDGNGPDSDMPDEAAGPGTAAHRAAGTGAGKPGTGAAAGRQANTARTGTPADGMVGRLVQPEIPAFLRRTT